MEERNSEQTNKQRTVEENGWMDGWMNKSNEMVLE